MDSMIGIVSNLPLSWSILFILLIVAMAYYWFVIHPKIKRFDEQEVIISKVIPQISDDVGSLEKSIANIENMIGKGSTTSERIQTEYRKSSRDSSTREKIPDMEVNEIRDLLRSESTQKPDEAGLSRLKTAINSIEDEVDSKDKDSPRKPIKSLFDKY